MIELSESRIYEFEEFRLDAKSRRLFRRDSGEIVPLPPKAVELLLVLVTNKGQILTKDELLEKVWDNSFVEESNLSQTIFVLRKTLGENTKEPRFIVTAPNRGYRFIATVREINSEDKILEENFLPNTQSAKIQSPQTENRKPKVAGVIWLAVPLVLILALGVYWFYPPAKPAQLREIKTIAVLPFEDSSGAAEPSEKYLGVGLAEALANKFGGLKQITVRPMRSVLKYADSREEASKIGRELRVDAVLDGRFQRDGRRIRLSVQLVRTSDNMTIWSENFDDDFTNLFAIQDSISQKVVQSLALQLDEKEREKLNRRGTANPAAMEEYLRGRFFWNKRTADGLQKAIEHFNRAVELDANFALAHAALAETYVIYNFYATTIDREAFPKARAAATRALELDGELAEAHAALGLVKAQYDFDWKAAEISYLRAIEQNPNYPTARQWYGEFLAFEKRTDESLTQIRKAVELDPTSLSTNAAAALPFLVSKQPEKALEVTDRALEMDADFPIALHYKARALMQLGKYDEAIAAYRQAIAHSNGSSFFKADLGCLYARAGREAETRKILAELNQTAKERYVSPFNFAMLHNALNEREKVFEFLNKSVAENDSFVHTLRVSTNFENLRDERQFIAILQKANLTER